MLLRDRRDCGAARELPLGAARNCMPQWTPDGTHIALVTAQYAGERVPVLGLLDPEAPDELLTFVPARAGADWLRLSPDGSRLAVGDLDQSAHVIEMWDCRVRRAMLRLSRSEYRNSTTGHWSPDGGLLVCALGTGEAAIWDTGSGERVAELTGPAAITDCRFSPDGRLIATGDVEGRVAIGSADGLGAMRAAMGHAGPVLVVGFSPDGRYVLSGGGDRSLVVWEAKSLEPLAMHVGRDLIADAQFAADGRRIALVEQFRTVRLLVPKNLPAGPPVLTAARLWLFDLMQWQQAPTALCPWHGERFEVRPWMLGQVMGCPGCGGIVKVSESVCDWSPAR